MTPLQRCQLVMDGSPQAVVLGPKGIFIGPPIGNEVRFHERPSSVHGQISQLRDTWVSAKTLHGRRVEAQMCPLRLSREDERAECRGEIPVKRGDEVCVRVYLVQIKIAGEHVRPYAPTCKQNVTDRLGNLLDGRCPSWVRGGMLMSLRAGRARSRGRSSRHNMELIMGITNGTKKTGHEGEMDRHPLKGSSSKETHGWIELCDLSLCSG